MTREQTPVDAGAQLAAHAMWRIDLPAKGAISVFWPMDGEIDTRPLLHELHRRGHTVLLPVTPERGQVLQFRRWTPETKLIVERFGTRCPGPEAQPGVPDVLFVPLLAFDRRGGRLGYGGGFYDRTLASLPGRLALGCAFARQEVDEVPMDAHDIFLDAVVTERGVIP